MVVGPWEGSVRRRRTITRKTSENAARQHDEAQAQQSADGRARQASSTLADLQQQVSALTRELAEAREQQTAASEVLGVISSAPGELDPVFKAMLENATRLCEAESASLVLREGDDLRLVARYNAPAALLEQTKRATSGTSQWYWPQHQIETGRSGSRHR
jgi:chromosome segregation ATPase